MSEYTISNDTVTILLCGVGGQGTILAADLLAHAAMEAGHDVKVSEIHGMAQRGGSVTTVVRYGAKVASMVADKGCADHIVAFETTEALRSVPFLKEGGTLLVSDEEILPLPVLSGKASMPAKAKEQIESHGGIIIPAKELAREAGNEKCSNVVLLGALAAKLNIDEACFTSQIESRVPPKTVETNTAAFKLGLAQG